MLSCNLVCGQLVDSSLLLVLVRNLFRAAVVSSLCWIPLLLWDHSKCLCACNKQTILFGQEFALRASIWNNVKLESYFLQNQSTWTSSLHWIVSDLQCHFTSEWNGFNVTSWRMAQQGWVAGSLYPYFRTEVAPPSTPFRWYTTVCKASTASVWPLWYFMPACNLSDCHWGTYGLISTASVWQLWSYKLLCDLYDRHWWW